MQRPTYTLHDGERVTIAEHTPELLAVDAEWAPCAAKPPVHLHPHQDERFEIHAGELSVEMDGRTHVVRAGESLEVPRGTVHKMWNSGGETVRGSWQVRPALRTADFFADVHASRAYRREAGDGSITLLGGGAILSEYGDVFRVPGPALVTRPVFALLALVARLRGYPRPAGQDGLGAQAGAGTAGSRRPVAAGSR